MRMKIVGTGIYAPPRIETAADLARKIGRSEDWIIKNTGVVRRHISEEPVEEMAAKAARSALGKGPQPDLILNASTTPCQLIPDSSVFIQKALNFDGIASYSIHATCLSFLVALHMAGIFVDRGINRRILVVSSEMSSTSRDLNEPESAALLGDGAAAAVIEPTPEKEDSELLAWSMGTWPKGAHFAQLKGAGVRHHPNDPATVPEDNLFRMDGPALYKMARPRAALVLGKALKQARLKPEDLDWVIPHQASKAMLESAPFYGVRLDQVVNILAEYGNCIAASLPMALAVANQKGMIHRGSRIMLVGMGAGLSIAAAILRW